MYWLRAADRTGPDRFGSVRIGPDRTGSVRIGSDRIGPDRNELRPCDMGRCSAPILQNGAVAKVQRTDAFHMAVDGRNKLRPYYISWCSAPIMQNGAVAKVQRTDAFHMTEPAMSTLPAHHFVDPDRGEW